MVRKQSSRTTRPKKPKKGHYALLVNKNAGHYQAKAVDRLMAAIKAKGGAYTLYEADSANDLLQSAEVAAGMRQAGRIARPYAGAGKVTALVACGGDGTFNLVARAGFKASLPVAQYPLGRLNNIARSFYGTSDPARVIPHILSSESRRSDVGWAGGLPFFCSLGLGFMVRLVEEMTDHSVPRFGLGWSKLGARAAAQVEFQDTILKVDSFRFEIHPAILNIHLLSHAAGLPFSSMSIPDDGHAEVIFDTNPESGNFSAFTRLIHSGKYLYGDEIRLYRGQVISMQPVKGRTLCLDGELIKLPTDYVEVKIDEKKLQMLY